MNAIGIRQLLEEVSAPQRPFGVRIVMEAEGAQPEPVLLRSAGLIYGLENLIDNAVDFATTTVSISAAWTDESVTITIADDGPGFAVEVLKRLGEPYVTTRRLDPPSSSPSGGLGLGLFIAKTLLERGGAQFEAGNRSDALRGATVRMTWKRSVFEHRGTPNAASPADGSTMGHPVAFP